MCDSTPIGELCETRVAMMKSDTETFTNGHGENQEVRMIMMTTMMMMMMVAMMKFINGHGENQKVADDVLTAAVQKGNTVSG